MTEMTRLNRPADDLGRLAQAAAEAMTDGMVERLSVTGANVLEVVDQLNDEATRDAVLALIDGLTQLHKSGALATLIDTVMLLHAARAAATDGMVERAFAFIEHMANTVATEDIGTLAHETKAALEDAVDECVPDMGGGLLGTLRMLRQPETQQALRFMLAFSCKLKKRTAALAKNPQP